jgi:hypothetical protein
MSSVKLFQRKKVQGEKVKVAKNRDDRDHPPNQKSGEDPCKLL